MGAPVDPTYPLFAIANILSSVMLFLVLVSTFIRQKWNLGVTFTCFWLFFGCIANAVDSIAWSDNFDTKFYVWCDIDSRLKLVIYVVKPMATLIISRRLYLIVSLKSVEPPSKAARRWDRAVEWTLGLVIPLLVAGPIYYVHQSARFEIIEGFGCADTSYISILEILTEESWRVVPALIAVVFYYPKLLRTYFRRRKDIDKFLHSNSSVSHANYFRILALTTIDILLTLPIGIVNIVLIVVSALEPPSDFSFYPGWDEVHEFISEPDAASYADMTEDGGAANLAQLYFTRWNSPLLAFALFGLFGVTSEARTAYWRALCTVGGCFGWRPTPRAQKGASLGDIEFGTRPLDTTAGLDLELESRTTSFISTEGEISSHQDTAYPSRGRVARDSKTDLKLIEEVPREVSSTATSLVVGRNVLAVGHPCHILETSSDDSADSRKATQRKN